MKRVEEHREMEIETVGSEGQRLGDRVKMNRKGEGRINIIVLLRKGG